MSADAIPKIGSCRRITLHAHQDQDRSALGRVESLYSWMADNSVDICAALLHSLNRLLHWLLCAESNKKKAVRKPQRGLKTTAPKGPAQHPPRVSGTLHSSLSGTLPPYSAVTSYAAEEALLISLHLSTNRPINLKLSTHYVKCEKSLSTKTVKTK